MVAACVFGHILSVGGQLEGEARTSLARRFAVMHGLGGRDSMKHYRVNKLAKPGGPVVKKKDILAADNKDAVAAAARDDDCPVCDVWHAGTKVGSIE